MRFRHCPTRPGAAANTMKTRSSLAAAAAVWLWCLSGSAIADGESTFALTIRVFSGRPDPQLTLESGDLRQVQEALSQAAPSPPKDVTNVFPSTLGYRHVEIVEVNTNGVETSRTMVRGTNVLVTKELTQAWYVAPDAGLEKLLVGLAHGRRALDDWTYEAILASIAMRDVPLRIRIEPPGAGPEWRLAWSGGSGFYQLQTCRTLAPGSWEDVQGTTAATNVGIRLTNSTGFFRLRSELHAPPVSP